MSIAVEIRGSGASWAVYHNGRQLAPPQNSYDKACISARAWERRLAIQHRPCLCCGTAFASEGRGNRMCDPCREFAAAAMV